MRASRHSTVAQPATRVHTTCWQLFRPDINTAHVYFFVAEVMSNYLTTDGLKIFSLLPEALLRPEAVAFATWLIRHVHTRPCHRPCCAYICERTASVIIHYAVLKMVGQ